MSESSLPSIAELQQVADALASKRRVSDEPVVASTYLDKPMPSEVPHDGAGPTKWVRCAEHNQEYVLTWLQSLELWFGVCPACGQKDPT